MGSVSTFPLALTPGASFAAGAQEMWLGWRRGTLLGVECDSAGTCEQSGGSVLRTWDADGSAALDAVLPADLAAALAGGTALAGPGADPSTAIVARSGGVAFVAADEVTVVPTDVLLNGASPWPAPSLAGAARAVVGFDGHVVADGDGGGTDALEIVEVTSAGARSVVGQAVLPADPERQLEGAVVSFTATLAEDAYIVVLTGAAHVEGAVFTCTARAS
jgi:hypothetical protein